MNDLQHSFDSAKDNAKQAVDSAREGVERAKNGSLHAFTSGAAALAKAVSTATVLFAAMRKLDRDDGLAWFGLARRRSPLVTMAVFGAGTAMGAGLALLFAPTSGEELRRKLRESYTSATATKTPPSEAREHEAEAPTSHTTSVATPANGETAKTA